MASPSPSQPRTMSIGGATYDLFVRLADERFSATGEQGTIALPLGEKILVEDVIETCGGGASNTSVGLARLGCQALFEGAIGSDQWGEKLMANLRNEGVDARYAVVVNGEVTSFSIILSERGGERVILYNPGTNAHLHQSNFDREIAGQMDWVYLNHILESADEIQEDLVSVLAREKPGLTWNPGGRQIGTGIASDRNRRLIAFTDLLLLNREEALTFTRQDTVEAALRLLLKHSAKRICVTDGKRGTLATDGARLYRCPCDTSVSVVDTTGAGDAFGTGVTWAILTGKDFPTALRAGTLNATSVVGAIGAQRGLLTETLMHECLRATNLAVTSQPL